MSKLIILIGFYISIFSNNVLGSVELNCPSEKLFEKQILNSSSNKLEVSAEESNITGRNIYNLKGNAILKSKDYHLKADRIVYFKKNKKIIANENIKLQTKSLLIKANNAKITNKYKVLNKAQYQLQNTSGQGSASTITLKSDNFAILNNANYSTCPLNNSFWSLNAEKITLDKSTSEGHANNVVLKIKNIPVFYLPTIEWVLKGRKTGALMPSYSSYSNSEIDEKGTQVKIPYYVNISNDKDLLITANHLTTRGTSVEAKYRQLLHQGNFDLEGGYLDEDKITNEKRWFLNTKLNYQLNQDINIKINTKQVSDEDYVREIQHKGNSLTNLESNGLISYSRNNLNISLLAQTQQALNGASDSYYRLPEFKINKTFLINGGNFKIGLVNTEFNHDNKNLVRGTRRDFLVNYSKKYQQSWYSLQPTFSAESIHYKLKTNNASGLERSRDTYSFELDSYLNLESQFSKGVLHTLKPRVYYAYTNKKEQLDLPVFDTSVKEFSYDNLFTKNNFFGVDRVNQANDVAIGLESRFINKSTGKEFFNIRIGQKFYQKDRINSITSTFNDTDATNSFDTRKYSDVAFESSIFIDKYKFTSKLRWDPETNEFVKISSEIKYQINKNDFFKVAHHKISNENILESYASFKVSKNVNLIGGINKSSTNNRIKKSSLGVIYNSCCWALKLVHFQEYIGDTNNTDDFDRTTKLEFVFKGLGSTTPDMDSTIKEYIPEYKVD